MSAAPPITSPTSVARLRGNTLSASRTAGVAIVVTGDSLSAGLTDVAVLAGRPTVDASGPHDAAHG